MQRALELATLGQGRVSPNPMVGCVLVHRGKIIGEGWHQRYGDWHAEVNAIQAVTDLSLLPESTAYVTLEPCSHYGKTPPCADLLIRHRVGRVVVSNLDSNPLVSGQGVEKLRQAGIEVEVGILEALGRYLNRRFFTFVEKKRPYVILKWAETADGFLARTDYDSKWISNDWSRKLVHQWRSVEDAVMVGTRTAQYDDPRLNVRDWSGRNPVRVVLDRHLRLSPELQLFDQSQPTLCYNSVREEKRDNLAYVRLPDGQGLIQSVLDDLYLRKIQSLLVEGGTQLLRSFLEGRHWDEIRVFKSQKRFGEGIPAPAFTGIETARTTFYDDVLTCYQPRQPTGGDR
ncbi:MAG: bifunctional diaminohydroxyphosphoribosylaminopyrimidine deaminase/5-amino-6-(5-phosphoribosylamino)uracil reductase RibD [Ferruginibacter sp.]|nr:bifunctional diaminohydroxyphosphoribosylaminopyrimidine deaminase/5-amino-6-(5-phosphoribosylamino)uracil reductase RibD [Cytophagales bacterium]